MPPPGMDGASFFLGASATIASVVIIRPAIDAASCSATRTTFAGSTMPALSMSTYCSDTSLDVGIIVLELADRGLGAQQRHAAARNDAFLDGGLRRMPCVVDPIFLFLDLDLGRTADADNRDATRELRQTLLGFEPVASAFRGQHCEPDG